jgi:acyl-CoA synthetase (AMP-forming)/AMP-acid ligase II
MTIDRIRAWAISQPDKTAVINDGVYYSYASFIRAIEASRQFLSKCDLPIGKTAVVMANDLFDGWCLTFALRGIGLTTIVVRSIAQAEELKVKDVACFVVTQTERNMYALEGKILSGTKVIIVPSSVYANIRTGDLPDMPSDAPPLGGHILYTSGTTGIHKKILFDGKQEDDRNAASSLFGVGSNDGLSHRMDVSQFG